MTPWRNLPVLSVVIVNFETPDYTLQAIRSIRDNPPPCAYEIIVIDNGSRDSSLDAVRDGDAEAICIETGGNLGFARANNLGINNARGEFVLLLNSDAKIVNGSLGRMLEYIQNRPDVGAMGPRQVDGDGKLQLSWGQFPTLISEAFRKLIHRRLSMNDLSIRDYIEERYAGSNEVDWVSGSCLMARKKALTDAGLLDEFFFMYFEDIDLCRRVKESGWKIHYSSDITIVHFGGVSAKKNILRVLVEYRRSQIYFTRKYYGILGVLILKSLLLFKYGSNFLQWGLAYFAGRVFRQDVETSFAKLLLTKKTIELVIGLNPAGIGPAR